MIDESVDYQVIEVDAFCFENLYKNQFFSCQISMFFKCKNVIKM